MRPLSLTHFHSPIQTTRGIFKFEPWLHRIETIHFENYSSFRLLCCSTYIIRRRGGGKDRQQDRGSSEDRAADHNSWDETLLGNDRHRSQTEAPRNGASVQTTAAASREVGTDRASRIRTEGNENGDSGEFSELASPHTELASVALVARTLEHEILCSNSCHELNSFWSAVCKLGHSCDLKATFLPSNPTT